MKQHTIAIADDGFDVLAHINPRSPTFYRDCAAAAAFLIHGEGRALGRCVLTAAIMHHVMQATREKRASSLIEVHCALLEVSRNIRGYTRKSASCFASVTFREQRAKTAVRAPGQRRTAFATASAKESAYGVVV